MLHDFGFNPNDFGNEDVLQTKINEIEETFDLILFVEKFAESMVLLKHSLCWEYEDLASLKLNSHEKRTKTVLSLNAKKQLKIWLKDSYILYDYFKVKIYIKSDAKIWLCNFTYSVAATSIFVMLLLQSATHTYVHFYLCRETKELLFLFHKFQLSMN